ncbi:hypothetical protein GCM10007421_32860 [Halopseudomonas oceani]|uniref:Tetratricopeptide repeat protein n=1 Tax=Halopseudomonas oceani TaxID=1708783 RepID=A0A2P4ERT3_9GAMM|nr:hypothetical protein [Halopseudomonas oceani]POB01492.1 hypothetical protein C1949_16015 [Halopseudomonas oceani]GGE55774.1 hypothetical protein GCM10007421_32860 [Halopseudomonas oceani]
MRAWIFSCLLLAAPVLAEQIDPRVYRALDDVRAAEQGGDQAAARLQLQAALPASAEGSLERALLQQRLAYMAIDAGDAEHAIHWLRESLNQHALGAEVEAQDRANLARLLMQQQRYRQAVMELEQLPTSDASRELLVQAYRELGEFSKALPLAEQVVRRRPEAGDIWYQLLVGMNYEIKRYSEAARWQQVLLTRAPDNRANWRQLASLQSLAGQQAKAAATMRLAQLAGVGLTPGDMETLVALHTRAGAPWQAARLLEQLLSDRLLDSTLERQRQLAQLWQAARDYPQALQLWLRVAAASGQSADRLQVAWLQYQQEQWQALQATLRGFQPSGTVQRNQVNLLRTLAEQALEVAQ